jgi:uncharacterized membrane protein
MKKINVNKLGTIILLFFTFSLIGWCWEVFYGIIKGHGFLNRGVLFGPWLPIYGFSGVIIYILLKRFKDNPIFVFVGSFVICNIIEYITSWYLETTKGIRWWDYSNKLFNINGRICLINSIFFGIMGCIFYYHIIPILKSFYKKIPNKIMIILCISLITLFSIDFIHSIDHPNLNKGIKIVNKELFKQIKK